MGALRNLFSRLSIVMGYPYDTVRHYLYGEKERVRPTNSYYDTSIHGNPDAMAWAKFFVKTIKQNNLTMDDILDEGYMVGWFANAMMAMHDSLKDKEIQNG